MLYWVTLGCFVAMATASICPFEEHQICNADDDDHKCLCALAGGEESPPEISCNQLIVRDEEGHFPVISVTFSLSDASDGLDEWPEDDFVEAIGRSLSVQKSDILILRATCQEDDKFTVQFGILKKGTNSSDIPYESDDFFPTNSLATRLKPMGHLQKIGDLEVESIEETEELTDIPTDVDNTDLIVKSSIVGAFFLLTFILGIWVSCRNRGYSDDLQKP